MRNSGKFSNNKIARLKLTLKDPPLTKDVEAEEAIESIIVTWGEVAAAGGYHVMWKSGAEAHDTDGSLGRRDVVVGGTTKTHTITGLTGGVEYEVQVIAYNEAGQSTQTPMRDSQATTTAISPPDPDNTVLVGNATQRFPGTALWSIGTDANGITQWQTRAQAFTTGDETAVLGSVTFTGIKRKLATSEFDVHIYSDNGGEPGDRLHTLTRPNFANVPLNSEQSVTFGTPAGETITLAANTTYFVSAIADVGDGEVQLRHTQDKDEDPESNEGWSIAYKCVQYDMAGTYANCDWHATTKVYYSLMMVLNSPLEAGKPQFSITGSQAFEGSGVQFTVSLSSALGEVATVDYSTADDTATTADSDYTAVSDATLTFAANETVKTFTIATGDDSTDEDDESFNVVLSSPSDNAQLGDVTSASGLIVNNDQTTQTEVTVSFERDMYSVAEGGSVDVNVKLSADPERTVTIPITATAQLTGTTAVFSVPTNVTFASGDVSKTITFNSMQDTFNNDGETVKLSFGSPMPDGVTATTGTTESLVSIADDDAPAVTVSFEDAEYSVAEGGSIPVNVKLSADPERTVTIPIVATAQLTGTTAVFSVPMNVTFASGDESKTITFSSTQDTSDNDGETVKLSFGSPMPDGVTATTGTTESLVSIADDDDPEVTVSFDQGSYTVAESDDLSTSGVQENEATVKVTLSADPERQVVIPIGELRLDGVTAGDYSGVPGNVTFESGDTEMSFTFTALHDTDDDDEQLRLTLGPLPPGVTALAPYSVVVSITDDDDPQVTVKFGAAMYTVLEGGSASVTVILSADPERTVTIPLTKDPMNGLSDGDYDGVPTNVEFVSGQTEAPFTVTASADEEDDDDESVVVSFGELPAGVTAPDAVSTDASETTIAIVDGNVPDVMVKIEASSQTVAEGASVTVTVTLDQAPERAVTIPLTTTPIGTYSADDLDVDMGDPLPTSVEFLEDELSKSFTIRAKDDDIDDDDEGLTIGLGTLPSKVSAGSPSAVTVNITDNDDPQVSVSFAKAAYSVAEGSQQAIMVKLSADPEREITLEFTYTEGDGADAGDYSVDPDPVLLVFNPGDTENSFTFKAAADDDDDDGETVEIGFTTPLPTGVTLASSGSETVVTIEPVQTILIGGGGGGGGGGGPSPSEADFEWTVKHDIDQLDTTNDWPTDVWSDGKTLWVAENGPGADDGVYAYDLTTGERVEEYEFPLAETNPRPPRPLVRRHDWPGLRIAAATASSPTTLPPGERVEALEIVLAERNRDARAIWSDGTIMWVLDGGKNSLFAYDLATRELLGEYFLDSGNDDPRGLWSDGIVYCVSDDAAKRIFAYRMPASEGETALERVRDEEFDKLSRASNNSPRGIWSDGDVMYVADANDDRVYTYNMPARADASLASLSLAGVNIGDFHGRKTRYEGTPRGGVAETTVEAIAKQSGAMVVIGPRRRRPRDRGAPGLPGRGYRDHRDCDLSGRQPHARLPGGARIRQRRTGAGVRLQQGRVARRRRCLHRRRFG